jgi:hypothetical protein
LQGEPQPPQPKAFRALLCTLVVGCACIAAPGALAAARDDPAPPPPTTTTPAPAPEPTPDPAPPLQPKPKPAPPSSNTDKTSTVRQSPSRPLHQSAPARRPAPAPVRPQARVYHVRTVRRANPGTFTTRHARAAPVVRRKPAASPKPKVRASKRTHARARTKHKARRAVRRAKKLTAPQTAVVSKRQPRTTSRVPFALAPPAQSGSTGPNGLVSFMIVLGLVGAIACFAVVLFPATYIRWRPAVIFASERHLDLTVAGVALLTIAASILVLGRGG